MNFFTDFSLFERSEDEFSWFLVFSEHFCCKRFQTHQLRFSSGPSHHLVFWEKACWLELFAIYVHKGTEQRPSQTPVW